MWVHIHVCVCVCMHRYVYVYKHFLILPDHNVYDVMLKKLTWEKKKNNTKNRGVDTFDSTVFWE